MWCLTIKSLYWVLMIMIHFKVCRISVPEGRKSCSHIRRRRASAVAGHVALQNINLKPSFRAEVNISWKIYYYWLFSHLTFSLQIANNSGYIQVDWKRVEKDVNKAKKQIKKGTNQAVPELNTLFDRVSFHNRTALSFSVRWFGYWLLLSAA